MQLVKKNKISFITGLLWLRHSEEHKVSVKQMKQQGKFNYYCKTMKLMPSYGFANINATKKTNQLDPDIKKVKQKAVTIKNPTSLGLFVANALDINKEVDDVFVCFRINETLIAYVFIYKGAIFAIDGEYISDVETVKAKLLATAREFNINNIRIFDDVPFYADSEFFLSAGLDNVMVVASFTDEDKVISASDYYLWQHKKLKKILASSMIRPITLLQREHRLILALLGLIAIAVLGNKLKDIIYPEINNVQTQAQQYVYVNKTGINAGIFLEKCFKQIDDYLQPISNWQVTGLTCNLTGFHLEYTSDNGSTKDITDVIQDPYLVVAAEGKSATLDRQFDLTELHPDSGSESLQEQLETLKTNAKENNLTVLMHGAATVEITSIVSPIFLYNKNVIRNLNILEISMKTDDMGLFRWTIKGDLNGK